jgi:hypothetical protein
MPPRLKTSSNVIAAALLALAATCMGCWEKIEYNGPRTTAGSQPKTQTEKQLPAKPTEPASSLPVAQNQADGLPSEVPTASTPPPEAPPAVVETPAPKQSDDLYSNTATPDKNLPAESSPSGASTPAESSSVVGDRYSTSTPVKTEPTDSMPATSAVKDPSQAAETPDTVAAINPPTSQPTSAPVAESSAMTPTRAAWLLGSRMSLATLAHDRGVAAQNVPVWFADAQSAAKFLGTSINELPEPAAADDTSPASRQAISYLLVNGQRIGRELAKQQGMEQSAIFEVALKSNLLLLLYTPSTSAGDSIAMAISKAAPQANLPAELWQPLVDALNQSASQADVRAAVRKMHSDIERYLAQSVEQHGK